MTIVAVKEARQTINVPFYGADLFIVYYNNKPYVPMKLITEGMGLNWTSQFTKLKTRFQESMVKITIPTKHGLRAMSCLALDELAGWLITINPNKVKVSARESVICYQKECHDRLCVYWATHEAKRKEQIKQQSLNFRYLIKVEVYDHHFKKTNIFTGCAETPEGIVHGVARQYGYYIENMISLPVRML
ncbi:phage antirepressor N-terminal domain-containing protein [Xenorhabdus budapestensis]|uniref:Phage antirepressor N-terminal domain-containing protein n=1 Tax=Xenorhabdus budapestensis TaxID=290110 RepID=A0ABX7VIM2_XENBU|nr:phage antirepressor N-terminal domain-containing protein [Xenorhabdus budapestensis]QTL40604.1 phage antirepressor N-terminal domain-containing protein [Xenorhabdus budapestensis]